MLDLFNNTIDPDTGYARGDILKSSFDEGLKYANAVKIIGERMKTCGEDKFYIFTGNIRNNPLTSADLGLLSEEWIGQSIYKEDLREVAIKHVSGNIDTDAVAVFNRTSAANVAIALALGGEGKTMISMAPKKQHHPSTNRGAVLSRSEFICVENAEEMKDLKIDWSKAFCHITSVTSELLYFNDEELKAGISVAKERGISVVVDDAYGARIRPIILGFTPSLQSGADVVVTNNDKAGLNGPRAGIMVGKADLVGMIYAKGCELGLEARAPISLAVYRSLLAFDSSDLLEEVQVGEEIYKELKKIIGDKNVGKSLLGPEVTAETVLRMAIERAGLTAQDTQLVPSEASAALGMELLAMYGIVTTNACGMPGAKISVRLKTNRKILNAVGGAAKLAEMFSVALDEVAKYVNDKERARKIILG